MEQKLNSKLVRDRFISEVFDSLGESESRYGIVFEADDLLKLVCEADGKTLCKDVTLPTIVLDEWLKNQTPEFLLGWLSAFVINGHLLAKVCCTEKYVIEPREGAEDFDGLIELEKLRLRLIKENRLSSNHKSQVLIKTCDCT